MNFSHQKWRNSSTFPLSVPSVFSHVSSNCFALNLDWPCSHVNFSYKAQVPLNDSGAHVHWWGATCSSFGSISFRAQEWGTFLAPSVMWAAWLFSHFVSLGQHFGGPSSILSHSPHHLDVRNSSDQTLARFCRCCPIIDNKDLFAKATANISNSIHILMEIQRKGYAESVQFLNISWLID